MLFNKLLDFFGSLKLTVVCLAFAMILVFAGTLAQVTQGIYIVQKEYFQSWFVFWGPQGASWKIAILPGGYLVGLVLLINLFVSQYRGFQFLRGKIGLYLTHTGLVLLLLGQLFTDLSQVESHMRLVEGQPGYYSESGMVSELAVIDASAPDVDQVVAIPESRLRDGETVAHDRLPFKIKVTHFFQNAQLENRPPAATGAPVASQGFGRTLAVKPLPPATRMDERNLPAAVIEITGDQGTPGSWLVSAMIDQKQTFAYANKTWELVMRPKRHYKPYSISLIKFTHEKYPGTEIPKNFSSRVEVNHPVTGEKRSVLIYMNNPLRYGGETYYQGSYDPNDPRVSILQVVRNPSRLAPYIACIMVGGGLSLHFMIALLAFVRGQVKARNS